MFEVTEEQYREFYRHKRKEKYLEEQVVDNILLDSMLRCVSELPEEDLRLIHALYYQRKSACEYAEEIGLCQKTVNNLKEWVIGPCVNFMLCRKAPEYRCQLLFDSVFAFIFGVKLLDGTGNGNEHGNTCCHTADAAQQSITLLNNGHHAGQGDDITDQQIYNTEKNA